MSLDPNGLEDNGLSRTNAGPGTVIDPPLIHDIRQTDPDVQIIVDAWPKLPEAIRAGIVAMVKTALPS